jgi:hypothetical protein
MSREKIEGVAIRTRVGNLNRGERMISVRNGTSKKCERQGR